MFLIFFLAFPFFHFFTNICADSFRLPIEISFSAVAEKEVNFNVLCKVKKKTTPLTLNVKAEGYSMNAQLYCEDSLGNKVALTAKGTNRINLGEVRYGLVYSREGEREGK